MPVDTKSLLIGGGIALVVIIGGTWAYKKIKPQSTIATVASSVMKRVMSSEENMSPCQKAARARARAQGAVGTIPLSYPPNSPTRARRIN